MKNNHEHTLTMMLQTLTDQDLVDSWVTTRQVADAMDWSIYQARLRLIVLRNSGRILSRKQGKGRHNNLQWKVIS